MARLHGVMWAGLAAGAAGYPETGRAEDAAVQLPTVAVTAEGESATGPVDGYVARRSVTATKTATALEDTPQSISVITRQQMEDRGVQNLSEAFAYSAGVIGDNVAEARYDKPVIRGFPARQYLDGLYINYYASGYLMPRIETYGLERVEILRGPSSVLYGANSPGGLVNLVSKRPTADTRGEVNVQYGSDDRKQTSFDFSGAADPNQKVLYRLTGLFRDSGTQTNHADDDRIFIAPALTLRPSADTTFTLLTHYQRDRQGTAINFLPREGTIVPTVNGRRISTSFFTGEPDFNTFDREEYAVGYAFEHRFNDTFTLRQNLRYTHSDLDYTGVYASGWSSPAQRYLRRGSVDAGGQLDTLGVDTQLQGDFTTGTLRHTALVGLDYQNGHFDDKQGFGTVGSGLGLIDPFDPVYGSSINPIASYTYAEQKQRQLGVYLQDQLKLSDAVTFVAGGRKDWARAHTTSTRVLTATQASTVTRTAIEQDDFTYRVGLLYHAAHGVTPYVSYATSFQPQAGTDAAGNAFRPTTGKQTEVGVKYQPEGSNSFITAAVYDLRQQDVLTSDPDHPTYQVQTGEVRSRGVELEATMDFENGFKAQAAYTYMDMEVTRSNGPDLNKVPTNRPRHTGSLWLDYTLRGGPLRGLGMGVGTRYIGSTWGDTANTFKVPSVWLADAALRYAVNRNWHVSLTATNLFDKEYVGQCGSATTCYYGYRRSVLATATYRW
ncbi:TonB-dependent siderophore receptor [Bordetella flabilis]|nr:TonB-dependent siderophore receptor [Bordetella flabilis]